MKHESRINKNSHFVPYIVCVIPDLIRDPVRQLANYLYRFPIESGMTKKGYKKRFPILSSWRSQRGFTIVEMLVVIGIIAILLSMATISLVKVQHNANVSAAIDQLLSDIRGQQTKAMVGTKDSSGSENSYGIQINANSYVLFQGASTGSSSDFSVTPDATTFTTNLPSSKVVFAHGSGEIGSGPYTITVTNTYGQETKTITINKYGVVTSVATP